MIYFLRSCCFYLGYAISLILIGIISLPLLLLPTHIAAPIVLLWNRFVLWWLRICCNIRYQITGDTLAPKQACVIIANHQSPWETIFLQCQFYPLTTVLKRELLRIPFFGWGMRILHPIAIDRSNPIQALKHIKQTGVARLKQGRHVLIFPEGTRQKSTTLGDFARSGADIAKAANCPIIAIAHNGGHCWPTGGFIKYPGTIAVHIFPAFMPDDQHTKTIMADVRQQIATKLEEISP